MNSQGPLHDERQNFCRRLRITRERKGITLATIADATKIRMSLFAGLERNELRGWPKAIYRRAYFREYIRIVDDEMADDWCADFNRLFTDEPAAEATNPSKSTASVNPPDDLRLAFDASWHGPKTPALERLMVAFIDASVCAATGFSIAWLAALDPSRTIATITLLYFSIATIVFGETPANWVVSRREAIAAAFGTPAAQGKQDEAAVAAPSAETPAEDRAWVTDARRVGPPASQLRVRFKA